MRAPFITLIIIAFLTTSIGPMPAVANELPKPGTMVGLSAPFNAPILKGLKVNADNPFAFDFILDQGEGSFNKDLLKAESERLVRYFLAGLTIPEKDLWVNLSPYEKDRIMPDGLGQTELGRDLLAQDYVLKQITASLIYPEGEIGKEFWKRVYLEASKVPGAINIPINTFNKVWIVPDKAIVYENKAVRTAYVVESSLKVMLEEDYLAKEKNLTTHQNSQAKIVRDIVVPQLTKEVNEGKNFAQLRQVYNSLILAAWYKKKVKTGLLNHVYADQNKVSGVTIDDPNEKQKIYERYLEAFKKGAYNLIKEELDPKTKQMFPRKYFSGGASFAMSSILRTTQDFSEQSEDNKFKVRVSLIDLGNKAMTTFLDSPSYVSIGIRMNEELKIEMASIIVDALKIDPYSPVLKDLLKLKHRVENFNKKQVWTDVEGQSLSLTPYRRQSLIFDYLEPNRHYIRLSLEAGLGLRVHLTDSNKVEKRYHVENFKAAQPVSANKKLFHATLISYTDDLLENILRLGNSLDGWDPDVNKLVLIQFLLKQYRKEHAFIPSKNGESHTFSYLENGVRESTKLRNLSITDQYFIQPYWEDGLGLQIYLISNREAKRYSARTGDLIASGENFKEVRSDFRDSLGALIREGLRLWDDPYNRKQNLLLREHMEYFNSQPYGFEPYAGGTYRFTPAHLTNHDLIFSGLKQGLRYKPVVSFERGKGFRVHMVNSRETLTYSVDMLSSAETLGKSIHAKLVRRAPKSLHDLNEEEKKLLASLMTKNRKNALDAGAKLLTHKKLDVRMLAVHELVEHVTAPDLSGGEKVLLNAMKERKLMFSELLYILENSRKNLYFGYPIVKVEAARELLRTKSGREKAREALIDVLINAVERAKRNSEERIKIAEASGKYYDDGDKFIIKRMAAILNARKVTGSISKDDLDFLDEFGFLSTPDAEKAVKVLRKDQAMLNFDGTHFEAKNGLYELAFTRNFLGYREYDIYFVDHLKEKIKAGVLWIKPEMFIKDNVIDIAKVALNGPYRRKGVFEGILKVMYDRLPQGGKVRLVDIENWYVLKGLAQAIKEGTYGVYDDSAVNPNDAITVYRLIRRYNRLAKTFPDQIKSVSSYMIKPELIFGRALQQAGFKNVTADFAWPWASSFHISGIKIDQAMTIKPGEKKVFDLESPISFGIVNKKFNSQIILTKQDRGILWYHLYRENKETISGTISSETQIDIPDTSDFLTVSVMSSNQVEVFFHGQVDSVVNCMILTPLRQKGLVAQAKIIQLKNQMAQSVFLGSYRKMVNELGLVDVTHEAVLNKLPEYVQKEHIELMQLVIGYYKQQMQKLYDHVQKLSGYNAVFQKEELAEYLNLVNEAIEELKAKDAAMDSYGGIDLKDLEASLEKGAGAQNIDLAVNSDLFKKWKDVPGFIPVVIGIEPLTDLPAFLMN
jgi:hypothetical protein